MPAARRPNPTTVPALTRTVRERENSRFRTSRTSDRPRKSVCVVVPTVVPRYDLSIETPRETESDPSRAICPSISFNGAEFFREAHGRGIGNADTHLLLRLNCLERNWDVVIARRAREARNQQSNTVRPQLARAYFKLPHDAGFTPVNVVVAVGLMRTLYAVSESSQPAICALIVAFPDASNVMSG